MSITQVPNQTQSRRPIKTTAWATGPFSNQLEHIELFVPATLNRELKIRAALHQAAHVTIAEHAALIHREAHECTSGNVELCNGPCFLLTGIKPEQFMGFARTAWAGVIAERLYTTGHHLAVESDLDFAFHAGLDHEAADFYAGGARAVGWEAEVRTQALGLVRAGWDEITDRAWTYLLTPDDEAGDHPESRALRRR